MTARRLARQVRSIAVNAIGRLGIINAFDDYVATQTALDCKRVATAPEAMFGRNARVSNWSGNPSLVRVNAHSTILGELLIFPSGGEITIGMGCFLGENSRIWSMDRVEIGDHVLISHNVTLMDTDSHELNADERAVTGLEMLVQGLPSQKGNIATAPIRLGDHVWVGIGSIILKGVSIGEKSIVAAGSVVTKDVPPLTLVAGNPARPIRSLADA